MIATTAQAAHVCTTQALLANGASQSMGAEVTPVRVCLLCLMAAAVSMALLFVCKMMLQMVPSRRPSIPISFYQSFKVFLLYVRPPPVY